MSVTLPNVPDAPGVPSVNRTPLSLPQAVASLSSGADQLNDLGGIASLVSPDAAQTVLASATLLRDASRALESAAPAFTKAASLTGVGRAAAMASGAADLVALVDPDLGEKISRVANTVTTLASAIRQLLPSEEGRLTADSETIRTKAAKEWGIYRRSGELAVVCDNIVSVGYRAEQAVADYPIEQGQFETYDKVARPFSSGVRATCGGSKADRMFFAMALQMMLESRETFNILTPETTYQNATVIGLSIDRSQESGAGMIIADIQLQEVRQTVNVAFSNTKNPASAAPYNQGAVQTTSPPANVGIIQ